MSIETRSENPSQRRFPVLLGDQRSIWPDVPDSISWETISPHENQARANHGQSLEVLAERGGLSPYELLAVLLDQTVLAVHAASTDDDYSNAEREDERI